MSDELLDRIEQGRVTSVLERLFRASRLLQERANAMGKSITGFDLRPAHTALFPHFEYEGVRITELARKVGISKQAVGQLIDQLEAIGAVERVPDPSDGRAKLVRFVRSEENGVLGGLAVLNELEEQLRADLGSTKLDALYHVVLDILAWLDAQPPTD